VISFLCSMWEAVLLSITPSYAQIRLKEGAHVGKSLQAFKGDIDRPLAAILTLNTIAHTVWISSPVCTSSTRFGLKI
jgi:CBS domain containing-hemolysin-like protein